MWNQFNLLNKNKDLSFDFDVIAFSINTFQLCEELQNVNLKNSDFRTALKMKELSGVGH